MKKSKTYQKEYDYNKLYSQYEQLYTNRVEKIRAKGGTPFSEKFSKEEFRFIYKDELADLKEYRATHGIKQRVSQRDVVSSLVNDTLYQYNARQTKAIKEAAKITGQDLSSLDIRTGQFDWTTIQDKYAELVKSGSSAKEAGKTISTTFFGSPE